VNEKPTLLFTQDDVWTLFHSPAFDFSVWEIFGALFYGGRLVIVPVSSGKDPAALSVLLSECSITVLNQTPAAFYALASHLCAAEITIRHALRLVIFGGDALRPGRLRAWRHKYPYTMLVNMYGITETTVHVTFRYITEDDMDNDRSAIGLPISTTSAYVLDQNLDPMPDALTGEIYVGGEGVARGYLRQPGLTASRMLPDPLGHPPGARLYKSGDLARRLPDGTLEYIGRRDRQVKIRGYRVELAEIERVLERYAKGTQAAVVTKPDKFGGHQLWAYVANHRQELRLTDMSAWAQQQLPSYMVPGLIRLQSWPLTRNGKIDRDALPEPEIVEDAQVADPRDNTETYLQSLWEEVLGRPGIGIHSDFFLSGGHSLSAVSVCARLSSHYGTHVPVRALFEYPTIEALAAYLRQNVALIPKSTLVPIQSGGTQLPLYCVHPAGGRIHCYVHLARALGLDQPVYGVQSCGLEENEAPLRSIAEMASRYLSEIRQRQPRGPYRVAGWSMGAAVAFEMACQLVEANESIGLLALFDGDVSEEPVKITDEEWLVQVMNLQKELVLLDLERYHGIVRAEIAQLSPDEQLSLYLTKNIDAGILPKDVTLEQARRYYHLFAANCLAHNAFSPRIYAGQVLLFRSSADDRKDSTYGWGRYSQSGLIVEYLPASHGDFVLGDNARILAEHLRPYLIL
jgi:nonribosomal peptide synthetase DhbF